MHPIAQSVLDFWFGSDWSDAGSVSADTIDQRMSVWFSKNADFDYDIERRFGKLVSLASKGGFDSWQTEPRSALALIILLDQFPRNLHRNSAKAFATDEKALTITKLAFSRGDTKILHPVESGFLLMPFQHAENLEDQHAGIAAYRGVADSCDEQWKPTIKGMLSFAERHLAVIEKFGRFPHRNEVIGRSNTEQEQDYLENGGDTF